MSYLHKPKDLIEAEKMVLKLYRECELLKEEADMYKKYFLQTLQLNEQLKDKYSTKEGLRGYSIDLRDEEQQTYIASVTEVGEARYRFQKRVEVLMSKLGNSYGERVARHICKLALEEANKKGK